ncbi:MAG: hypothetical protein GEU88_14250 [Solirubrobacterales bacterium]|nr:hypothetical protein [Solirubrobacterales bacterium]
MNVQGSGAGCLRLRVLLMASSTPLRGSLGGRDVLSLKLIAGVVVALATWGRWVALDDTAVAVVLALQLLTVPVVLVVSPLISGRHVEIVTAKIWAGAALVLLGSLVLIAVN